MNQLARLQSAQNNNNPVEDIKVVLDQVISECVNASPSDIPTHISTFMERLQQTKVEWIPLLIERLTPLGFNPNSGQFIIDPDKDAVIDVLIDLQKSHSSSYGSHST